MDVLAGKSAALILRHINPSAMAAARTMFDEETLQLISRWSMKDAPMTSANAVGTKSSQRDR